NDRLNLAAEQIGRHRKYRMLDVRDEPGDFLGALLERLLFGRKAAVEVELLSQALPVGGEPVIRRHVPWNDSGYEHDREDRAGRVDESFVGSDHLRVYCVAYGV